VATEHAQDGDVLSLVSGADVMSERNAPHCAARLPSPSHRAVSPTSVASPAGVV